MDEYSNLDYALAYIKRKWAVFPVWEIEDGHCACPAGAECEDSPGKHPVGSLVPRGVIDASTYPDRIKRWWKARPQANIGISAGLSKLIFFDIDTHHGGDESELRKIAGSDFGQTIRAVTPSGGGHLWLKQPDDRQYTIYSDKPAKG